MMPCLLIAIWKMWNELDSWPWTMAKTPSGCHRDSEGGLCRNRFSHHEVGCALQRVILIQDQMDLHLVIPLDDHRMLQEVTTYRGEARHPVTPRQAVPLEELHQVVHHAQQPQEELVPSELAGGQLPRTERLVRLLEEILHYPSLLVRLVDLRRRPVVLVGHDRVVEDPGLPEYPPLLPLLDPATTLHQHRRDRRTEVVEQLDPIPAAEPGVLIVRLPLLGSGPLQERADRQQLGARLGQEADVLGHQVPQHLRRQEAAVEPEEAQVGHPPPEGLQGGLHHAPARGAAVVQLVPDDRPEAKATA